jgi:hypothetical protein
MEHLFHESFGRYIPHSSEIRRRDYIQDVAGENLTVIPNSLFDMKIRGVCKVCNESWMNDWDMDVQHLVIELANARTRSIPVAQISALARWATKVALLRTVVNRGMDGDADPAIFHALYQRGLPPAPTVIRVGFTKQVSHEGGSNGFMTFIDAEADDVDEILANARDPRRKKMNVVSWGLGHLHVHVTLASPAGGLRSLRTVQRAVASAAGPELRLLWPNSRRGITLTKPLEAATTVQTANLGYLLQRAELRSGDYLSAGVPLPTRTE